MRTGGVACDAFVERFSDLFAVAIAAQFLFVGGAADEGDFRENPGHGGFSEDYVGGFLYAAIAQAGVLGRQSSVKGALHAGRQAARLLNFFVKIGGREDRYTGVLAAILLAGF